MIAVLKAIRLCRGGVLLGRATRRLEQEETALGRAQAFCTLRLFLGDEGVRAGLSYEAAAQALNVGLPALKR